MFGGSECELVPLTKTIAASIGGLVVGTSGQGGGYLGELLAQCWRGRRKDIFDERM